MTNLQIAEICLENACIRLGFDPKDIQEQLRTRNVESVIVRYGFSMIVDPINRMKLAGAIYAG